MEHKTVTLEKVRELTGFGRPIWLEDDGELNPRINKTGNTLKYVSMKGDKRSRGICEAIGTKKEEKS